MSRYSTRGLVAKRQWSETDGAKPNSQGGYAPSQDSTLYQPPGSFGTSSYGNNLNPYERHVRAQPQTYEHETKISADEELGKPTIYTRKRAILPAKYKEQDLSESSDEETYPKPYVPKTVARKYKRKTSEQKDGNGYKLMRARNNDAVRKSRQKQKELEEEKTREYDWMKLRIVKLEKELEMEKKGREEDRVLIEQLLKQGRPSQASNYPPNYAPMKREEYYPIASNPSNPSSSQFNGNGYSRNHPVGPS